MLLPRIIPCLLLRNGSLVKTVRFRAAAYIGDPINTVRIFNEKEVDELIFLDITASRESKSPPFELLARIASECFMPFTYGGGVTKLEDMRRLFSLGSEKIALNAAFHQTPDLVRTASREFGSQSIVVSLDVRRNLFGRATVVSHGGTRKTGSSPLDLARRAVDLGAGELLINSVNRDGMMEGYDLPLIREITAAVDVPVIACGGAGNITHISEAIHSAGAAAAAAGSMVVYQGPHRAVLINFPDRSELTAMLTGRAA